VANGVYLFIVQAGNKIVQKEIAVIRWTISNFDLNRNRTELIAETDQNLIYVL
jgi:hypothetical protein